MTLSLGVDQLSRKQTTRTNERTNVRWYALTFGIRIFFFFFFSRCLFDMFSEAQCVHGSTNKHLLQCLLNFEFFLCCCCFFSLSLCFSIQWWPNLLGSGQRNATITGGFNIIKPVNGDGVLLYWYTNDLKLWLIWKDENKISISISISIIKWKMKRHQIEKICAKKERKNQELPGIKIKTETKSKPSDQWLSKFHIIGKRVALHSIIVVVVGIKRKQKFMLKQKKKRKN